MKHRATVLCVRDGRVLLVAKRWGRWAFPGGTCKTNESLSQAAARELAEETRIVTYRVEYLIQFWGARTRHFVFAASLPPFVEAAPANEISRCKWVRLRDLKRTSASISTKGIAHYLLTVRRRPPIGPTLHGASGYPVPGVAEPHDVSHKTCMTS